MPNRLLDLIAAATDRRKGQKVASNGAANELRTLWADALPLDDASELAHWGNTTRPDVAAVHVLALVELGGRGGLLPVTMPTDPDVAATELARLADWCGPHRLTKRQALNRLNDATVEVLEARVAEQERRAERAEVVAEALADLYAGQDVLAATRAVAAVMLPEPPPLMEGAYAEPDPVLDPEVAWGFVAPERPPPTVERFGPTPPPKPGHVT